MFSYVSIVCLILTATQVLSQNYSTYEVMTPSSGAPKLLEILLSSVAPNESNYGNQYQTNQSSSDNLTTGAIDVVKVDSFESSSFPKVDSYGSSSPPKVDSYGSSSPPKVDSYGSSSPPKVDSYGSSSPPKVESYGSSSPPKVESDGSSSTPDYSTQTSTVLTPLELYRTNWCQRMLRSSAPDSIPETIRVSEFEEKYVIPEYRNLWYRTCYLPFRSVGIASLLFNRGLGMANSVLRDAMGSANNAFGSGFGNGSNVLRDLLLGVRPQLN